MPQTGPPLGSRHIARDQALRDLKAAEWEAMMIKSGADSKMISASRVERAAQIETFTKGFQGLLSIYSASPGREVRSPMLDYTPSLDTAVKVPATSMPSFFDYEEGISYA